MSLAPLEVSEWAMQALVRAHSGSDAELRDAVEARMWCEVGSDAVGGDELDAPSEAFREPHALGWLHQYLGAEDRRASFEAHTRHEAKHGSATVSTQLFTPRWIADWLVAEAIEAAGCAGVPTVLDPACGGGQMLLAAVDRLVAGGAAPREALAAMRGVDLDPVAVDTCRMTLKLHAARLLGERDEEVERSIDANIVAADGLFSDIERAEIVVTNPPYMGTRSMPPGLKASLAASFPGFHHDLYLAFVARCTQLATRAVGILAQQTLWYLKRFEGARRDLLDRGQLIAVAHLGANVFEALRGEKATVMAWVWRPGTKGATRFYDLRGLKGAAEKRRTLAEGEPLVRDAGSFAAIPAAPLAFWVPPRLVRAFESGPRLGDLAEVPGSQNKTGNNGRYVRPADEVSEAQIRAAQWLDSGGEEGSWVYYSKGGRYAPWWGNWDFVVDWSEEARRFYAQNATSNLLDERYWYREGLCYSDFGGKTFNARWMPRGCVFDMAGPAIFVDGDDHDVLAALLVAVNSETARTILNALNPTLHYQVRDVRNLPLPFWSDRVVAELAPLGHELVRCTRENEPRAELEQEARQRLALLW